MSQSAVNVELALHLKDGATAGLKSVTQAAVQSSEKTSAAAIAAATKSTKAAEASASKSVAAIQKQHDSHIQLYREIASARERLGVRSEQVIRDEIHKTESAYQQLARAGVSSARELARAQDASIAKVRELRLEMGELTRAQKLQSVGQKYMPIAAGAAAAAYTLSAPAKVAMSYDRRLAHMANTAYSDSDEAGYHAGKQQLESAVNKARKAGGGTREQAADTLDTMISSGVVSVGDSIKMLPGIMKAATASGTEANELAMIAIRAKQSFKIKAEDLPSLLSAAMAAGQAGGFELKDMSKWLPQQMAMAGNLGLSGKDGFAKLAAWNQASVITAGTKDEAGNNLRDLLNELNSPHFRAFVATQLAGGKSAKKGEKELRKKSVDDIFLDYQSRGIDKVTATIDVAEKIFAKDKTYAALQTKLRATKPDDKDGKREILEAMAAQAQGTQVGNLFHNQQSLMAFLGLLNNQQYTKDVLGKVRDQFSKPEEKTATSVAYGHISETSDYKVEQAKEDSQVAQKSAMDSLTPAIGKAADAFGELASKNPLLVGSTVLATTALSALAGVATLTSLAMARGKGSGSAIKNTGAPGGAAPGEKSSKGGTKSSRMMGKFGIAAAVGGAALSSVGNEESAAVRYGSAALSGASLGAMFGPIGAVIGAAGGLAIQGIMDSLKPHEQKPNESLIKLDINLPPGATIKKQLQSTVGNTTLHTAVGNLWHGAPR